MRYFLLVASVMSTTSLLFFEAKLRSHLPLSTRHHTEQVQLYNILTKNDDYSKHAKITEDEANGSFAAPNKPFPKNPNGWENFLHLAIFHEVLCCGEPSNHLTR